MEPSQEGLECNLHQAIEHETEGHMHPPRTSSLRRGLQIVVAALGFGLAWWRLRKNSPSVLAERLRGTLEGLGTTFVKLG